MIGEAPENAYDPTVSLVEEPLVTCVVPMYNVSEDLEECLASLVDQTLQDVQIVLVDDGATDATPDIALRFASAHPNVEYHRIENQGLGHARNYGAQFARGEWLMFPDSDDIVESYALEEMAALGTKHGCDMVVGDAVRFNTKRQFDSNLHRIAFRTMGEVGHISKNPDLLYDTTAWNKLFKASFYFESKLKWVEGRLYEDIPVTIPAHFLANRVAYLDKVVYRWRVRDGQSRSITQNRKEIRNFRDRLAALKDVDAFFDAHVEDHELRVLKDYKWLNLDLKLYVNTIPYGDEEYRSEVIQTISDYLSEMEEEAFRRLRAIDRVKYRYIARNNLAGLSKVLEFEKKGMRTLRITEKNGRYFGKYPFKDIPADEFEMTSELRENGFKTKISRVTFDDGMLNIRLLANVESIAQKGVSLSAAFVDRDLQRVMELDPSPVRQKTLWKRYKKTVNSQQRDIRVLYQPVRSFDIKVPLEELASLEEGRYEIMLGYTSGNLRCAPKTLSGPMRGGGPRPRAIEVGHALLSVSYSPGWSFVLTVRTNYRRLEHAELTDNNHILMSLEGDETFEFVIPSDPVRNKLPYVYEEICLPQGGPYYFLRQGKGTDAYAVSTDGAALPNEMEEAEGEVESDVLAVADPVRTDELWRVAAFKNGCLSIKRLPPSAVLESYVCEGKRIVADISMRSSTTIADHSLLLKGKRFGVERSVPLELTHRDGSLYELRAEIPLDDDVFTSVLRNDSYALRLVWHDEDGVEIAYNVITEDNRFAHSDWIEADGYRYRINSSDDHVVIDCRRIRAFWELSAQRNRFAEKYLYPALRLLPIRKKTILFESYWGASTDCNPRALYDYIDQHHPEYECVWSVKDLRIPLEGHGKKVQKDTLPYYFYLARSHYFVNNVNFPDAYVKRSGQTEIQTMHGTPLKTLGLDVASDFPTPESVDTFLRRCGRWDYLIVQSPRVEEITKSCYAFDRQFLRTGYPRNDALMSRNTPEVQRDLKRSLGVDPDSKLVLYVPTWRSSGRFDLQLNLRRLIEEMGEGYTFALRRHHLALPGFVNAQDMGSALDFTYEKSIDDLLLAADVVITDYSSIMFDYALLDRPMLFFVYDLEEYRDELRGFNIDLESEAPGPLLKTTEEVAAALKDLEVKGAGESLGTFKERFLTYETGHAAQDVFRQVFE